MLTNDMKWFKGKQMIHPIPLGVQPAYKVCSMVVDSKV